MVTPFDKQMLDAYAFTSQQIIRARAGDDVIAITKAMSAAQLAGAAIIALHYMDEEEFVETARKAYQFSLSEDDRVRRMKQ